MLNLESKIIKLKKRIFNFWDTYSYVDLYLTMKLFNLKSIFKPILFHWMIEWRGGGEKIKQKLKSFENKNFVGQGGSYNFNFYVKNSRLYNEFKEDYPEIYFDAIVDGNGDVTINLDNGKTIDNIYDAYTNDDIDWEVDNEIRDIIYDELKKINDFQIPFEVDRIKVIKNYPLNLR